MRILALLLILAQVLLSQVGSRSPRSQAAVALVDEARALTAEFRADVLLRLAESSLVTEASWKQELIEEAYWSGSHASLPYMQHADARSDSLAENEVRANRLEALTLQARAVQAMLSLNTAKALHLSLREICYRKKKTPRPMGSKAVILAMSGGLNFLPGPTGS